MYVYNTSLLWFVIRSVRRNGSMATYDWDVGKFLRRKRKEGPFTVGTGGQNLLKIVFVAGDVNGAVMIAAIFFGDGFHQGGEVRHGQEPYRNDEASEVGAHVDGDEAFGNLGVPCGGAVGGLSGT